MELQKTKAPHVRSDESVSTMMRDVFIALLAPSAMAIYYYGLRVVFLLVASVLVCYVSDSFCLLIQGKKRAGNMSPIVTGMIIALMMPASIPYYVVIVAGLFAILVAKHPFGGLGNNIFNPAISGIAFVTICWSEQVLSYPSPSSVTPLPLFGQVPQNLLEAGMGAALRDGAAPNISNYDLLFGNFRGPMGATNLLVLFLCLVFLLYRRITSIQTPLAFLFTASLISFVGPRVLSVTPMKMVLLELCAGSLVFAAVFVAADPVTCPTSRGGKIVYGVGCGAMTMLFRYGGTFSESVMFSILIMNALSGFIDQYFLDRKMGISGMKSYRARRQAWKESAEYQNIALDLEEKKRQQEEKKKQRQLEKDVEKKKRLEAEAVKAAEKAEAERRRKEEAAAELEAEVKAAEEAAEHAAQSKEEKGVEEALPNEKETGPPSSKKKAPWEEVEHSSGEEEEPTKESAGNEEDVVKLKEEPLEEEMVLAQQEEELQKQESSSNEKMDEPSLEKPLLDGKKEEETGKIPLGEEEETFSLPEEEEKEETPAKEEKKPQGFAFSKEKAASFETADANSTVLKETVPAESGSEPEEILGKEPEKELSEEMGLLPKEDADEPFEKMDQSVSEQKAEENPEKKSEEDLLKKEVVPDDEEQVPEETAPPFSPETHSDLAPNFEKDLEETEEPPAMEETQEEEILLEGQKDPLQEVVPSGDNGEVEQEGNLRASETTSWQEEEPLVTEVPEQEGGEKADSFKPLGGPDEPQKEEKISLTKGAPISSEGAVKEEEWRKLLEKDFPEPALKEEEKEQSGSELPVWGKRLSSPLQVDSSPFSEKQGDSSQEEDHHVEPIRPVYRRRSDWTAWEEGTRPARSRPLNQGGEVAEQEKKKQEKGETH